MTVPDDSSQAAATTSMTSRIIVKNLPKRITEKRMREHFGQRGNVTDVKLMNTAEGVFRRFAYVGYATVQEAADAVEYYNLSFIDTSRIEVQSALSFGNPNLPRAWSRYSSGSSRHTATAEAKAAEEAERRHILAEQAKAELERKRAFLESIYEDERDPQLAKFMNATKSKSRTKTWENDGEGGAVMPTGKKPKIKVQPVKNRKTGGEGLTLARSHLTFSSGSEAEGVDEDAADPESSDDELYEDFKPRQVGEVGVGSDDEGIDEIESEEMESKSHPDTILEIPNTQKQEETTNLPEKELDTSSRRQVKPELISETGRLFVRNLPFSCGEQDLQALFSPFGVVDEVHLSLSRETKKPKGFAHVQFVRPADALQAFQALDGSIFQGRLLHILPAEAKPAPKADGNSTTTGKPSSYKAEKEKSQKESAQKDFNWNSLFVRSDTVLESIASQLGVRKAELMNPSSGDLAIRLATAETHLINDTKQQLLEEGVNLEAFGTAIGKTERSGNVILVKNLPFACEKQELSKAFGKHGPLGRVILPPSRAIAIIEFLEASDARSAFRALAYSKFHSVPLFLEWAPEALLRGAAEAKAQPVVLVKDNLITEQHNDDAECTTLYVKNVNFDTVEDTLRAIFADIGPLRSVSIPRKRDPRRAAAGLLSMGFAFVQYVRPEHATLALDRLQGTLVDGHALVLKRSNAVGPAASSDVKSAKTRKHTADAKLTNPNNTKLTSLMVRNIPFEASEREVQELFRSFSQVKRIRLPRKFDGGHRGFGFIDFVNNQEARSAMATLAHTHLYGRHLVLEWAKPPEEQQGLAGLRDRAARHAGIIGDTSGGDLADMNAIEDMAE